MTVVPITWKPIHLFALQINGLVSIGQGTRNGRVKSTIFFFDLG